MVIPMSEALRAADKKLAAGKVTLIEFLYAVSHSLDSQIARSLLNLHDLPADPESSDDSSSDDEDVIPPNEQCSVCLLRRDENCHSSLNHSLIHLRIAPSDQIRTASSNPGLTQGLTGRFQYLAIGGIMGKSRFLRRNYGKISFLRRNYNNLGKCGGNVGKSHFLRRNYGKLSFFEGNNLCKGGGIITTYQHLALAELWEHKVAELWELPVLSMNKEIDCSQ
jgi:hypothetical protein